MNIFGNLLNTIAENNGEVEQHINETFQQAATRADTAIIALKKNVPLRGFESSSLTSAFIYEDKAYIVNIGACRTYHLRNNCLKQITQDHIEGSHIVRALGNPWQVWFVPLHKKLL